MPTNTFVSIHSFLFTLARPKNALIFTFEKQTGYACDLFLVEALVRWIDALAARGFVFELALALPLASDPVRLALAFVAAFFATFFAAFFAGFAGALARQNTSRSSEDCAPEYL